MPNELNLFVIFMSSLAKEKLVLVHI